MEEKELQRLNIKKLDEKIWVFNRWIKNPQEYINFYLTDPDHSKKWVPWYKFGEMISDSGTGWGLSDEFPTKEAWTSTFENEKDPYKIELADLFYDASKIYIEETKITLPSWASPNWGIAKYLPDVPMFQEPNFENRTMVHHTDFQQELAEYPGEKFGITAVVYLNDDYEGGEIEFRITEPNDYTKVVKEILYKPEAGDILMFPSTPPYFHGVVNIKKSPKYIMRLYWKYYQEASETWKSLRKKYGDDRFQELEKARRRRHDLSIESPVLYYIMTIGEYYDLLESGNLKDNYKE